MQVSRFCIASSFQGQWPRIFLYPSSLTSTIPHSASPFPVPVPRRPLTENISDFWQREKRKTILFREDMERVMLLTQHHDSLPFLLPCLGKSVVASLPS